MVAVIRRLLEERLVGALELSVEGLTLREGLGNWNTEKQKMFRKFFKNYNHLDHSLLFVAVDEDAGEEAELAKGERAALARLHRLAAGRLAGE